jgi:TolB-like protein
MRVEPPPAPIRFGLFELDPLKGDLRRQGIKVAIHEQPLEVLRALIERPGEVVTRQELQQRLWREDTFVEFDNNLNNAISRLRECLGDSADNPRFIETIPRRGYRFVAPVANAPGRSRSIESLAVLPFQNLSGDVEQEFLADGMTEAVILELARTGPLSVTSRTSAMSYKKTRKRTPQIADELGVDVVVEGSVQREGNLVRVTVQLIRARDDVHVWANVYEKELASVLALHRDVAQAIAAEIRSTVSR